MTKSQNTHFIPEWVLRRFRAPVLLELDIFTGKTKQRNPRRAGSGQDLWPPDVEDELGVHDNAAAQIFRNRIDGRDWITLSDGERIQFARWLSQFAARVPTIRADFRMHLEEEKKNPRVIEKIVETNRSQLLELVRQKDPDSFEAVVADLGVDEAERLLLAQVAQHLAASEHLWPSHEQLHHYYLRNNQSEHFAQLLCEYHWNWHRTDDAFVIGDNPLVRWHDKTQRWNYGIKKAGVEITMPLTLNLCLRLTKTIHRHPGQVKTCTGRQTRIYNERQRLAAVQSVYGNAPEVLDFIQKPMIGWHPNASSRIPRGTRM